MIDVQHLTKRYGSFTAVDDISFEARSGEVLGFLGPNGAGKTTTMRILTGYMPPTAGRATVAGWDVFEDSIEARKHTGYLPETVPLYPDMTARGYLDFVADLRRLPRRREKVRAALERVGLEERADSLIRNLSKGMRQRLGLAQAIIHSPEVLILDEPTIGLDPHQVIEVRQLVRDLGKHHTVMFSTHILSEAEQVCDRVLIIEQGRIVAEGAPQTLRDDLGRGGRVYLRLATRQGNEKVVEAVRRVGGVEDVTPEGDGYLVRLAAGRDVRADIAAAVMSAGGRLIELRPWAMTLEDIFLELTTAQLPAVSSGRRAARQR